MKWWLIATISIFFNNKKNNKMSTIKALGVQKIKGLGLDNFDKTNAKEEHLEDMISQVYWTTVKPTGNDVPISKALLGEKVYLAVKTKNVPNSIAMLVRIYEYNKITKSKKLFDEDVVIRNNFGATKALNLEKSEKWLDLLKETGEDNELEIYAEISAYGETVNKGKYLKVKNSDKVVVFFIGGAADKDTFLVQGPNNNILSCKNLIDKNIKNVVDYNSFYLDFREAYNDHINPLKTRFEQNILQNISKESSIFVVGHSLGGWNGAHLTQILTDKGYKIETLITLDPVGINLSKTSTVPIYFTTPKPKYKFWINILASPKKPDDSDTVANLGGRWIMSENPSLNIKMDINHADANSMFVKQIYKGKSCFDILLENIKTKI